MMRVVTTLSHRALIHGPRTALSLHRSSRKSVALGSRTPARTWHVLRHGAEGGADRRGGDDLERVRVVEAFGFAQAAVQRVVDAEHVSEGVGGGEGDGAGADNGRVDEDHGDEGPGGVAEGVLEGVGDPESVGGVAVERGVGHGEGREDHVGAGRDVGDEGADDGVGALIADPAGRDALVNDIGLLEEQLPGGDGGADDGDE